MNKPETLEQKANRMLAVATSRGYTLKVIDPSSDEFYRTDLHVYLQGIPSNRVAGIGKTKNEAIIDACEKLGIE